MRSFIWLMVIGIVSIFDAPAQSPIIRWAAMDSLLHPRHDTVYVFNFWATWCKPCVEELPEFRKAEDAFKNQKVRFLYISLDFVKDYKARFLPFVATNLQDRNVFLLNEPDYNSWIDKVDPKWQGGIPATLILRAEPSHRNLVEGALTYDELETQLNKLINHE